jgi:hypothetical protein
MTCVSDPQGAPDGVLCANTLKAVKACLRLSIVMTDELADEWARHNSRFGRLWLMDMYNYGRVEWAPTRLTASLVQTCRELRCGIVGARERRIFNEDFHLIIGALTTDKRIISCDNAARCVFADIASRVGRITQMLWSDPFRGEDDIINWISGGLRARKSLKLGNHIPYAPRPPAPERGG